MFINNFLDHVIKISLIKVGVKGKTPFLLFKAQGRGISIVLDLFWIDEGVACFFPCLHAAAEALHILISHLDVLDCLPGSARFLVSAAVKDNLLVFRKRGKF